MKHFEKEKKKTENNLNILLKKKKWKFSCQKLANQIKSKYLPSGLDLGMKEYFKPEGNPAPPLPLSPDFLISSITQSGPFSRMSFVRCQSPYLNCLFIDKNGVFYYYYSLQSPIDIGIVISVKVRENTILIL